MSDPMDSFAGIPGTLSESARRIRWVRGPDHAPTRSRTYHAEVADGILFALLSRDAAGAGGKPLWHLSVSHRDRDGRLTRCPTWDELKHARYQLVYPVAGDFCMVLVFPRKGAEYTDFHPTTLHLWESEKEIDR